MNDETLIVFDLLPENDRLFKELVTYAKVNELPREWIIHSLRFYKIQFYDQSETKLPDHRNDYVLGVIVDRYLRAEEVD